MRPDLPTDQLLGSGRAAAARRSRGQRTRDLQVVVAGDDVVLSDLRQRLHEGGDRPDARSGRGGQPSGPKGLVRDVVDGRLPGPSRLRRRAARVGPGTLAVRCRGDGRELDRQAASALPPARGEPQDRLDPAVPQLPAVSRRAVTSCRCTTVELPRDRRWLRRARRDRHEPRPRRALCRPRPATPDDRGVVLPPDPVRGARRDL